MFSFIHTSDWHIGHSVAGISRKNEFGFFIDQLVSIVEDKKPDALLLSGDVYDSSVQSISAREQFCNAMMRLHEACPEMNVVVTAGNHDSPSGIAVDGSLWNLAGVTRIGGVQYGPSGPDYGELMIPVVRSGKLKAVIAAVPYVFKGNLPETESGTYSSRVGKFYENARRAADVLMESYGNTRVPVIAMGHLAVVGKRNLDIQGHDMVIGSVDTASADDLSSWFDYVALGHIHKCQALSSNVYYSGAPLFMNFGETGNRKVLYVRTDGENMEISEVALKSLRRFVTVPDTAGCVKLDVLDSELDILENFKDDSREGIFLNVRVDMSDPVPDIVSKVAEIVGRKTSGMDCPVMLCKVEPVYAADGSGDDGGQLLSVEELTARNPMEIADDFFTRKYGRKMDDDLRALLESVMERLRVSGE